MTNNLFNGDSAISSSDSSEAGATAIGCGGAVRGGTFGCGVANTLGMSSLSASGFFLLLAFVLRGTATVLVMSLPCASITLLLLFVLRRAETELVESPRRAPGIGYYYHYYNTGNNNLLLLLLQVKARFACAQPVQYI